MKYKQNNQTTKIQVAYSKAKASHRTIQKLNKDWFNRAFKEGWRIMNKREVKTAKRIQNANVISAQVGTNTPMRGDAGHEGHTIFELKNLASTSWQITIDNKNPIEPNRIKLELFGDTEANTFIEAIDFALETHKNNKQKIKK